MISEIKTQLPLTPYLDASLNYMKEIKDTCMQYQMIKDRLYWLELCSDYLNELKENKKENFLNNIETINDQYGFVPLNLNTEKLFSLSQLHTETDKDITILKINTAYLDRRIKEINEYKSTYLNFDYIDTSTKIDNTQLNEKPTFNQVISHLISSLDIEIYQNN